MPLNFAERQGDIFGDRINLGKLGDGLVQGDSLNNAFVILDSGTIVPGRVSIKPIIWDQGIPGRCFVFTPNGSNDQYLFSDTPLVKSRN